MKPTSLGVLALLAACSSSTSPGGGSNGSLTLTITAPAGMDGRVTVLGPNGYRGTVAANGPFPENVVIAALEPGSYTIFPGAGTSTDPIVGVGYAGTVTGSPLAIPAGGTATATVIYASPYAAAGVLWVASASRNEFAAQ